MQSTTLTRRLAHLLGVFLIALTSVVATSTAASADQHCVYIGDVGAAQSVSAQSFEVCYDDCGNEITPAGIEFALPCYDECGNPISPAGGVGEYPPLCDDCGNPIPLAIQQVPDCDDECDIVQDLGADFDPRCDECPPFTQTGVALNPCDCLDFAADQIGLHPCDCLDFAADQIGLHPCDCFDFGADQVGIHPCQCLDIGLNALGDISQNPCDEPCEGSDLQCGDAPYLTKTRTDHGRDTESGSWWAEYEIVLGVGHDFDGPPLAADIQDVGPTGAMIVDLDMNGINCKLRLIRDRGLQEEIDGPNDIGCWAPPVWPGDEVSLTLVMEFEQCGGTNNVMAWLDEGYWDQESVSTTRPSGDIGARTGITIPDYRAQGSEQQAPDLTASAPGPDCPSRPVAPAPSSSMTVTSTASPTSGVGPGDTVTFQHVVTNTGGTTLQNIVLTNEVGSSGDSGSAAFGASAVIAPAVLAAQVSGGTLIDVITAAADIDLLPGASVGVVSTYVVREGDLPGPLTSTVRVASGTTTATSTSLVGLVAAPALVLELASDVPSVEWTADAPPSITWTYVIRNIGDVTIDALALADSNGTVGLAGVGSLPPGGSHTVESTYQLVTADALAGEVANTARVNGVPPGGGFVEGLASATVAVTAAPTEAPAPAPAPQPLPEAEVLGEVVDRGPAPAPAPVAAPETLPATGEHDAALGAFAFLLTLFGLLMVVGIGERTVTPTGRRKD